LDNIAIAKSSADVFEILDKRLLFLYSKNIKVAAAQICSITALSHIFSLQ
jgi:hypothetical protein